MKEKLTTNPTETSATATSLASALATTKNSITQNGVSGDSPPSPSTTPLSLLSESNDHNGNNHHLKSVNDDENMENKIKEINEMIERSQVEEADDDAKMNCNSNRSSPSHMDTSKSNAGQSPASNHDGEATERSSNKYESSGNHCNNLNSNNSRTMVEELALKNKEVSLCSWLCISGS